VLGTIGLFDFCDVQYVCDIPDEGWRSVSRGDPLSVRKNQINQKSKQTKGIKP